MRGAEGVPEKRRKSRICIPVPDARNEGPPLTAIKGLFAILSVHHNLSLFTYQARVSAILMAL